MGIPGLWAELAPAAQTTTLPSYCLTTFSDNANELRGLRLGIDASLWLFHAQQSSGGANPYLRLLFYRLAKLLTLPVLPLFVFDGPSRPTWKRGKQVKGRQHAIEQPFTQLIEAFGYQWHRAPGEAEAELAYLSQKGLVDAVLTDDSDALLFGSQVLIRNWGKNLSGTKAFSRTASASSDVFVDAASRTAPEEGAATAMAASRLQLSGSDRDHLITLYTAHDLASNSDLGIDRDGVILIALMSGGDYDTSGLMQCGVKIALALARGGYGTRLVEAFKASYPDQASAKRSCTAFQTFVRTWLEEVREELRTNERGFLPNRRHKLASTIQGSFLSTEESRRVLAYYVYPLTSESTGKDAAVVGSKSAEIDLTRLARLAQLYFHWSKEAILSKFRTILGPGVVARQLRQEILEHNDGAGEGLWAALVESPATKALRRHNFGLNDQGSSDNRQAASKAAAVAASQKKQRPLHDSPNATRITDFFAKAGLHSSRNEVSVPSTEETRGSVEILAIKMQRRHAALAPFLDYRVLVSVEELNKTTEAGIDVQMDAELAAARAQSNESESEADEEEEGVAPKGKTASTKRVAPDAPLLMWIPEPFLKLSVSGSAPLAAFLKELERKAAATRRKGTKKAASASKAGQTTLNAFVKPGAKPFLASQAALPKPSLPKLTQKDSLPAAPRTPRQLRVPSGLRTLSRRTESFPVPAAPPSTAGRTGMLARHTSMPNTADEDGDSSIEFLGAFVSSAGTNGKVHSRPSTPPTSERAEEGGEGGRLTKSPKKGRNAAQHRSPTVLTSSFSALGRDSGGGGGDSGVMTPSQRALAEPEEEEDETEEEEEEVGAQRRGAQLFRKGRISAITISDSSDGED